MKRCVLTSALIKTVSLYPDADFSRFRTWQGVVRARYSLVLPLLPGLKLLCFTDWAATPSVQFLVSPPWTSHMVAAVLVPQKTGEDSQTPSSYAPPLWVWPQPRNRKQGECRKYNNASLVAFCSHSSTWWCWCMFSVTSQSGSINIFFSPFNEVLSSS